MADRENIFLDKIKLAGILVAKEMNLIQVLNMIKTNLRYEIFEIDRIAEYNEWHWAWQNVSEMYDFLKYQYLDLLGENEKKDLKSVMDLYNDTTKNVGYKELLKAYNHILKIMAKTGFHSVSVTNKSSPSLISPTTKW